MPETNTYPRSDVYLYQSTIDPTKNMYIDDLEDLLSTIDSGMKHVECQYIKHDLTINLKLEFYQEEVLDFDYNYIKIVNKTKKRQGGREVIVSEDPVYYYIKSMKSVAFKTIAFELEMDVVNSLGQDAAGIGNPRNFLNTTHVLREHKDRFLNKVGTAKKRKVSQTIEDFNPIVNKKITDEIIKDGIDSITINPSPNWYLINYVDDYEIWNFITNDTGYEIKVPGKMFNWTYAVNQIMTYSTHTHTYTYTTYSYGTDEKYYSFGSQGDTLYYHGKEFNYTITIGDKVTILDGTEKTVIGFYHDNRLPHPWGEASHTFVILDDLDTWNPKFLCPYDDDKHKFFIMDPSSNRFDSVVGWIRMWYKNYKKTDDLDEALAYEGTIVEDGSYYSSEFISSIKSFDLTDPKTFKILKLPYCPIECEIFIGIERSLFSMYLEYNTTLNTMGYLRYKPGFGSNINALTSRDLGYKDLSFMEKTIANPTIFDNYDVENESKLWNSQYFISKFGYDNFNCQLKPELIDMEKESYPGRVNIKYRVNDGLGDSFGFKFETARAYNEEDYDEFLLVNRNNELPLYSNSYLDYMRNGYNFDKKANSLANETAVTNAFISTGTKIASATATGVLVGGSAGGVGAAVGAAVGLISGVATSVVNINNQINQQENSIAKNIQNLKSQGLSVSSSDDLTMLKWYNGNKLHYIEYSLPTSVRESIGRFFSLYGYTDNTYHTPSIDSRIWYNYVQCEPVLNCNIIPAYQKKWFDALKEKYRNGVTVYHKITYGEEGSEESAWDLNQEHENWEQWLINQ